MIATTTFGTLALLCCAALSEGLLVGESWPKGFTEAQVSRPIKQYIKRDSSEFKQLIVSKNSNINFVDDDAKLMTNRLQQRINALAALVRSDYATDMKLKVKKTWQQPPAPGVASTSLHHEARAASLSLHRLDGKPLSNTQIRKLSKLAIKVKFDFVFQKTESTLEVSVVPDKCDKKLDLAFLLDGSGSIETEDFDKAKEFVVEVASYFDVGPDKTRISVSTFSGSSGHSSTLKDLPDCPKGTLFDANGKGCICAPSAVCIDDATGKSACTPATMTGVGSVEYYGHSCTTCRCEGKSWPSMESVVTNFDFNDIVMTKSSVAKAVDAIAFPQGGTHTSEGLAHVRENIFDAAQGMRESKDGVPRVLVVVTDGQANPGYEPKAEATLLKKTKNVKIFAVGVSNYNLGELRDMSSDPDSEHTIVLKSFDDIFGIVNRMGALSCAEAAVIDNGGPTDTEVDPGTFLYFHPTECDDINADVTVTLKAVSGETRLYMSWSEANPGPLNADHMVETNSATKVVTLARAGHAGDPIYLSVYGVGLTNNEFSLDFTCDEAKATTKAAPTDVPVAVGDNEKSANDPTTDPATGNDADASSNIGAIVGAVVGVLVLLALLLLVGVRRRRGAVGSGGEGALAAHDPSMYNNPLYRQAQDGEKGTSRENLIADDAPTRINTNAVYQSTDSAQPIYDNSSLAPAAADDQAVYASLASPAAYADVGEANSPEPAYMNAVQEDQSYMHMRSPYNTPNNAPVSEYGSPEYGSSDATC